MVDEIEGRTALKFSSQGLLVQDKDGTVYFFDSSVLDGCRKNGLSRKGKAQTKKFFNDLREKGHLVDAAFIPTFHILEGM